mmetsp:Transcript_67641/g.174257  ORF Transcript_67641/g.174257 Transcript_67641/m.174257 type:complete len:230 (-) Transcript_67641:465-1154(-)
MSGPSLPRHRPRNWSVARRRAPYRAPLRGRGRSRIAPTLSLAARLQKHKVIRRRRPRSRRALSIAWRSSWVRYTGPCTGRKSPRLPSWPLLPPGHLVAPRRRARGANLRPSKRRSSACSTSAETGLPTPDFRTNRRASSRRRCLARRRYRSHLRHRSRPAPQCGWRRPSLRRTSCPTLRATPGPCVTSPAPPLASRPLGTTCPPARRRSLRRGLRVRSERGAHQQHCHG